MTLQLSPIKITLVDRHVPLASMPVPAGFPSPAADWERRCKNRPR